VQFSASAIVLARQGGVHSAMKSLTAAASNRLLVGMMYVLSFPTARLPSPLDFSSFETRYEARQESFAQALVCARAS
jgi:hypothetical protein